ncbi:MAG: hypothetical protein VX315_01770, partial [Pseudomonadota bacterium]|nr:hypothetical protein [Pseudomonadota bacterium]
MQKMRRKQCAQKVPFFTIFRENAQPRFSKSAKNAKNRGFCRGVWQKVPKIAKNGGFCRGVRQKVPKIAKNG